ncbi:MAG: hypothetical protein CMC55_08630 [Flavobacteriaceae bacterium]|nr:hypothetical protein [Flavobacteriaceae bacterium]|tara:strand:- start:1461 stop:1733 length:273 start_codon:yes stop_codon:yes gene_type:complete
MSTKPEYLKVPINNTVHTVAKLHSVGIFLKLLPCTYCNKDLTKTGHFYRLSADVLSRKDRVYSDYFCPDCFNLLVSDYDQFMFRFNLGLL